MIDTSVTTLAVGVPTIIGLVQVAKQIGVPNRIAPLVSILFGILAGLYYYQSSFATNWPNGIVFGISLGLSASGLYAAATTASGGVDIPTLIKGIKPTKTDPTVTPAGTRTLDPTPTPPTTTGPTQ